MEQNSLPGESKERYQEHLRAGRLGGKVIQDVSVEVGCASSCSHRMLLLMLQMQCANMHMLDWQALEPEKLHLSRLFEANPSRLNMHLESSESVLYLVTCCQRR